MRRLAVTAVLTLVACSSGTGGTGGGSGGGAGGGTGGGSTGGGTGGGSTGGGSGGSGGGAAGLTLDQYCAKLKEANCAFQIRCGLATPGADCDRVALSERFQLINARIDCLSNVTRAGLDAGRTAFHGDKAASCFANVATSALCGQLTEFGAADCSGVFVGSVASGGSCYGNSDCAPSLYCGSSTKTCPGTCKPQVGDGGFAPSPGSCASGTFYFGQSDGGGTCLGPVGPGASCAAPPGSLLPLYCTAGNTCLAAADGGRSCLPFKAAGDACDPFGFGECAYGTDCGPAPDGGNACSAALSSGDTCAGGGLGRLCKLGLSCTNNHCSALVDAGGACSDDRDCIAGHACGAGQKCVAYGTIGAACNTANFQDDCSVGLFCNPGTAHCETRLGLDAVCAGNLVCSIEQGLSCTAATDGGMARCQPVICLAP